MRTRTSRETEVQHIFSVAICATLNPFVDVFLSLLPFTQVAHLALTVDVSTLCSNWRRKGTHARVAFANSDHTEWWMIEIHLERRIG